MSTLSKKNRLCHFNFRRKRKIQTVTHCVEIVQEKTMTGMEKFQMFA